MKDIHRLDFEGYLEDARRVTVNGIAYLDGNRSVFILTLLHGQLDACQAKLNEVVQELNYQRNRRMIMEKVLKKHGIELPPPEVTK